jgi:hypothetical protein
LELRLFLIRSYRLSPQSLSISKSILSFVIFFLLF